ncbi:MAG: Com family DNA-binding transcriptional regulator [Candidatus Paceibacterota bacterium]
MSSKNEYRCIHCNKLFFKGVIKEGEIEVKCRGCKNINPIKILRLNNDDPPEKDLREI